MRNIHPKFWFFLSCVSVVSSIVGVPAYAADEAVPPTWQDSFVKALTDGTPMLDARYRFENVEQNGLSHDAYANTLRTRLGYETGDFKNFKARVQVENVMPFGSEFYNDGTNGQTQFPTIADPRATVQLYEANMTWSGVPQSTLTLGRQALSLDNERWVGTADWRQLGQTMDALTAQNHSIQNVDLQYTYGFHENRVFGPRAGSAANISYDMHTHLLHGAYTGITGVKLVGYGYLLDLSNAPTLSSQTYGARAEVKRPVYENVNAVFNGEYARQMDYQNNPVSFGFNYYLAEPGVNVGPFTGKVGYEVMGGDGNHALQAPLDTGHAFNGWAEKFLTTPATGLTNVHIATEYKSADHSDWLNATVAKFTWYDFHADSNSTHYGNEYDFWLGQTFFKHYTLGLQYADFRGDQAANVTDTRKIVVQLQAKY